jgi:hypothetical protein
MPEFFKRGDRAIAHSAIDPDVFKNRSLPQLRSSESPEHYLDWEMVGMQDFPPNRYDFIALVHGLQQKPAATGFLPYAVVETFQELKLAFSEHRRWPENSSIRSKILIIAGHLAHYAGDLFQPLHTTIHHDGRATLESGSPHTGIHFAVDGVIVKALPKPLGTVVRPTPIATSDLLAVVQSQFESSFQLVDRVYELETDLRAVHEGLEPSPPLVAFSRERRRSTIAFIAGLFRAAWIDSEALELPPWLNREEGR